MFHSANGAKVYYEQHGEGDHNVLLLHGWGCSTEIWKPVTQRLCPHVRVTVLDFPGHGQSGRPPVPWGPEDYAQMVAEMITHLHIEGCDIIGHSHGGKIAIVLAALHPELPHKLVLTGASGLKAAPTSAQKRRTALYKVLGDFLDFLARIKIFGSLPKKIRELMRKQRGSTDYNALDEEMRKTFVKLVNFDVSPYLEKVKASTLLIWGSADTETPLWMGKQMESTIQDAGLVVFDGCSHYAYLERIDEFVRIAKHFLLGGTA